MYTVVHSLTPFQDLKTCNKVCCRITKFWIFIVGKQNRFNSVKSGRQLKFMLMASSKVIASRSPPNSDLPRDSPTSSINIHSDQATRGFGSMNMDEIFRNVYPDSTSFDNAAAAAAVGGGLSAVDGADGGVTNGGGSNTVDEVWRDYVAGGGGGGGGSGGEPAMTLEDFLAKAGAVNEEDVRVPAVVTMPPPPPAMGGFGMEAMMSPAPGVPAGPFAAAGCVQNVIGVDFGNGMSAVSGSVGGGGRGKRRVAVDEVPLDKATQQKQRRMIKNRESAARSRERKQAYTVELESLVTQLEEENARLLREEAELNRQRYKQLMEKLVPVVEKRRPPGVLRSTRSI